MTNQLRSKRRLLPKRSVVDIDYISPKPGTQDLLFTATPSKKDHQVINELLGKETKEQLPQVIIGKPKQIRATEKDAQWSNFFEQHKIIPAHKIDSANNDNHETSIKHVNNTDQENVTGLEIKENLDNGIYLNNRKLADMEILMTLNEENLDQIRATESVYKKVQEFSKMTAAENKPDDLCSLEEEPVVIIETIKKKKTSYNVSFMLPPTKLPKKPRSRETIQALKHSGALDWITTGKDTDPRKHDIGKVRKRQLERRLHRPLTSKRFINKPKFIVQ